MNRLNIVAWRAALCFLALAALLRLSYGPATELDYHVPRAYAITCSALTLIALIAWALRIHSSRLAEALSSALIAAALSAAAIYLTARFGFVHGMPWEYFYKDNAVAAFQVAIPAILGTLTGLLCLIREAK